MKLGWPDKLPHPVIIASTLGSFVLSHTANWVASLGCLVFLNVTVVDPPQLPLTVPPACHCGTGATRQSPEDFGAFVEIVAAPQTAEIQVATVPFCNS